MPATPPVPRAPRRTTVAAALAATLATVVATTMSALVAAPAAAHSGATAWDCIAHYESTHRWKINTGNGHYGGLQFSLSTWRYYGGPNYSGNAYPHRATRAEQIMIGKRTAHRGWKGRAPQGGGSAWPNTWGRCH